jgi:hypothetical protein
MEFREMLETAAAKAGDQTALAEQIGVARNSITDAKRGTRGLPDEACALLAQLLGVEFGAVIAARNRSTAKNDEVRNFWKKVAGVATFFVISGAPLPPESHAAQGFNPLSCADNVYYVKSSNSFLGPLPSLLIMTRRQND